MRAERGVQPDAGPARRRVGLARLLLVLSAVVSVAVGAVVALRRPRPALPSYTAGSPAASPSVGGGQAPAPEPEPAPEPAAAQAPTEPGAGLEQLERVSGLGRRSAEALVVAGITSLAQLAGSDAATLGAALDAAGVKRSGTLASWPSQAERLLQG